jgi:hypothetical protein
MGGLLCFGQKKESHILVQERGERVVGAINSQKSSSSGKARDKYLAV